MPFCTQCGANVTGTFCSQCGSPASGAQTGAVPARKTSPIVWVLVIVLGILIVGGVCVLGIIGFVAHRMNQAGVTFVRGHDGNLTVRGADGRGGSMTFGGSTGKLPSWVPVYPGSQEHINFSVRGSAENGAEGGNYTFTTSDDASKVKAFYSDKCNDLGMKVSLDSSTPDGGMIVAVEEDGDKRSLTAVVSGHHGGSTVNVTYGRK
jgi:hypothetical protein